MQLFSCCLFSSPTKKIRKVKVIRDLQSPTLRSRNPEMWRFSGGKEERSWNWEVCNICKGTLKILWWLFWVKKSGRHACLLQWTQTVKPSGHLLLFCELHFGCIRLFGCNYLAPQSPVWSWVPHPAFLRTLVVMSN